MADQAPRSLVCVQLNIDRGQFAKTFTIQKDILKCHGAAFLKYLNDECNPRKEGAFMVYDLFDVKRAVFEQVLQMIVDRKLSDSLPGLRASRLNAMVEIYVTAHQLRLNEVMNIVLDGFLEDANTHSIFPQTLAVQIYERTAKGCGLRSWFVEQVTISVDVEEWEGFTEYWPHDALVDLAVHCVGRYVPPLRMSNIARYYQAPFPTDSDDGE